MFFCFLFIGSCEIDIRTMKYMPIFNTLYKNDDNFVDIGYKPKFSSKFFNHFINRNMNLAVVKYIGINPQDTSKKKIIENNFTNQRECVEFKPAQLTNLFIQPNVLNNFTITLKNIMKDEKITISSIYSNNEDIIIPKITNIDVFPNESLEFSFSIISREKCCKSETIFIETNIGTFFYYISYTVYPYSQFSTKILHEYKFNNDLSDIHIHFKQLRNQALILDSNIFENDDSFLVVSKLKLKPRKLKTGTYRTFIYILSDTNLYVYQIFLHISKFQFFLPQEKIELNLYQNNTIYTVPLSITNPTEFDDKFIDYEFNNNSNDFFSLDIQNTEIKTNKTDIFANLQFSLKETGNFNSKLEIILRNETKLYIDISVTILHGEISLHPMKSTLNNFLHNFTLRNSLNAPLLITGMSINSTLFHIDDFTPQIVAKRTFSNQILISLNNTAISSSKYPVLITIHTNYTDIQYLFDYYVNYGLSFNIFGKGVQVNEDHFYLGTAYQNSSKNLTLQIRNLNNFQTSIKRIKITNTTTINTHNYTTMYEMPEKGAKIIPFSLTFLSQCKDGEYSALKILTDQSYYKINLLWDFVPGNFELKLYTNHDNIFGTQINGSVTIKSNHTKFPYIVGGNINIFGYEHNLNSTILMPKHEHILAEFNQTINTEIPDIKPLFDLIENSPTQVELMIWANPMWNSPKLYVRVMVELENDFFFTGNLSTNFTFWNYDSTTTDLGIIHTGERIVQKQTITNHFIVPVLYKLHKPPESRNFKVWCLDKVLLQPQQQADIYVIFELIRPRKISKAITITSNATSPFYFRFNMIVKSPSLKFVDEFNSQVYSIDYSGGFNKLIESEKWQKCVAVHNIGSEIIKPFHVSMNPSRFLKYTLEPSDIHPSKKSLLCFNLYMWLYENETDNTDLVFSVTTGGFKYSLPVRINISDDTVMEVYSAVDATIDLLISMSVIEQVASLLISLVFFIIYRLEVRKKLRLCERAARHYSMSLKESKGCQKDDEERMFSEKWNYSPRKLKIARSSENAIKRMENALI